MSSDQEQLNDRVRDTIRGLRDEDLVRVMENRRQHTKFALQVAQEEISRRGGLGSVKERVASLGSIRESARDQISLSQFDSRLAYPILVLCVMVLFYNTAKSILNRLPQSNDYVLVLIAIVMVLFIIAILLSLHLLIVRWEVAESIDVAADHEYLYITRKKKEIEIPLSQISRVEEDYSYIGRRSWAIISFRSETELGRKIRFLLPAKSAWSLFRTHPNIKLLRKRIGQSESW